MNHSERVYAAINHSEPDRVPKGELGISGDLVNKTMSYIGREDLIDPPLRSFRERFELSRGMACTPGQLEFIKLLDMDIMNVGHPCPKLPVILEETEDGRVLYINEWAQKELDTGISIEYMDFPIDDPMDVYKYEMPSPGDFTTDHIKSWADNSDIFVASMTLGTFLKASELMGFENFSISSVTNPKEVARLANMLADYNIEMARLGVHAGSKLIFCCDDIAYNSGLFVSPNMMRELFFPALKRQVEGIKALGVPVFMHTDGNIMDVIEDIADLGFDGIQSLQPSAGMDIGKVKLLVGDRLCLMGNIDIDHLLPFGTPEEVEKVVGETIEAAMTGGGYILSTCNMLSRDIPPINAIAMYRTCDKYGKGDNRELF